ncbi:MAG: carbon starvation protein A [Planctomycetia bacterium]
MSLPLLVLGMLAFLALGYTLYGRFLARRLDLDDRRATPAVTQQDGVDFVPTRPFYLLGEHFSAISAAGPIAGPILACQQFGWLPCLLWIGLGVVFIGAVHDFVALVASIRHKAASVAEIVREHLGEGAYRAMLGFIWLALVYVVLAFTDITAATFTARAGEAGGESTVVQGGAVAFAGVAYLALALVMGLLQRFLQPPLWLLTLVFVPATLGVVWLGTQASTLLLLPHMTWALLILAYCFVASLTPVWALLQPRGYLGGFVLYLVLAVGALGVLLGGFEVQAPAVKEGVALVGWEGALLPFLFVTIACGACSGFHGLVCSGTTSKQLARESHSHPVGYGAMLLEGFVAVIALATVMIAVPAKGQPPGDIYAQGIARCIGVFAGEHAVLFATTFGAMAFSTFVFDTLDVATRLGRYLLQELFGWKGRGGAVLATAASVAAPGLWLLEGGRDAYKSGWLLFGTSNQLLAALTLMGVSVWLHRQGKRCWYTLLPCVFVFGVTSWSLAVQVRGFWLKRVAPDGSVNWIAWANLAVATGMGLLALGLVRRAIVAVRRPSQPAAQA